MYSYDKRQAGLYDNRLQRAASKAKTRWGAGWDRLSKDMQNAYLCQALVEELGALDFESTFGDNPIGPDITKKLLDRLTGITEVCTKALQTT